MIDWFFDLHWYWQVAIFTCIGMNVFFALHQVRECGFVGAFEIVFCNGIIEGIGFILMWLLVSAGVALFWPIYGLSLLMNWWKGTL